MLEAGGGGCSADSVKNILDESAREQRSVDRGILFRLVKQLPGSFEDVFDAAARFVPASSRPEADDPSSQQRIVQTELIRGRERWRHLLVDRLPSWVTPVRHCYFPLPRIQNRPFHSHSSVAGRLLSFLRPSAFATEGQRNAWECDVGCKSPFLDSSESSAGECIPEMAPVNCT